MPEQTGNKITYKIKKFEDLSVDTRFNEWVKDFNKDFVLIGNNDLKFDFDY